ncbi:hypothetical protein IV203_009337 [Nitzschia inconspicua]|uniref:PH domain-containing protein n=1 Tax=Nitzschia inconspicua TaxID=303405 RepID=A0A9K3L067_9STRA|nr:hypothetical protein IV203_009337 [Nitzschia inconspicua]
MASFVDDMEYEMSVEDFNHKNDLPIVETVSEDDDSYIEIEVTDDEASLGEDVASQPQLPPRPPVKSTNPFATISSTPPSVNRAPAPASAPPAPPATPAVPMSPSKKRAKDAGSAGLSELSKQLRILQAKNESQAVDINRLERQLRILADLQGVNVADLRKALEDACASEAFGELQNRVAKLRYELEAATLAKQGELRRDTTAPHIANLELRVGELEEIEEKQKAEIRHLYQQLQYERGKATRLDSENELLKKEMEEMRRRLQQETTNANRLRNEFQEHMSRFQEDQARKMKEELEKAQERFNNMQNDYAKDRSATSLASTMAFSPEMLAEYERMGKMLKERDEQLRIAQARMNAEEIKYAQRLKEAEERARNAEMNLKLETDKFQLMIKELEDADRDNGLKVAQGRARLKFQEETVQDLEQQLNSLYTAFTLLKEEFDSENKKHAAMMSHLNDADEEIARQANRLEKEKSHRSGRDFQHGGITEANESYIGSGGSVRSVPHFIATPQTAMTTPTTPSTPISTRGHDVCSSIDGREDFDSTPAYASAQAFRPTPERTPSTWQLLFPKDEQFSSFNDGSEPRLGERLISGPLTVECKGMIRKWKTKPSTIYLRGDHYQWQIGEKRSFPLQFGVSKVEFHPNHPLSFVVYVNPYDTMAPMVKAACQNERDYNRWMSALTKATTGEDFLMATNANESRRFSPQVISNQTSTEDQEAAELQRVLELSKHEV